jgi:hypothetical protein
MKQDISLNGCDSYEHSLRPLFGCYPKMHFVKYNEKTATNMGSGFFRICNR